MAEQAEVCTVIAASKCAYTNAQMQLGLSIDTIGLISDAVELRKCGFPLYQLTDMMRERRHIIHRA